MDFLTNAVNNSLYHCFKIMITANDIQDVQHHMKISVISTGNKRQVLPILLCIPSKFINEPKQKPPRS